MNVFAPNHGTGRAIRRNGGARLAGAVVLALAGIGVGPVGRAQNLQDYFTNRVTFTNTTGDLSSSNVNATVEPGEPKHGGKTGGHSMWISWVAATNGVVRFQTPSSTFDTLLSAYQFTTTNGATFADLREAPRDDDDGENEVSSSKIEFGVRAGERYEIAVDGYFGATGQFRLRWTFDALATPPPQILRSPADRAVNIGDTVELVANVTNQTAGQLKWYFNGNGLNVTTTNLVINNFQAINVGRYKLRVSTNSLQFFSVPTEVQINTEGSTDTLAQGKILDSPSSPLIGSGGSGARPAPRATRLARGPLGGEGVVRGYDGSQVFNTTYALVDPNEPAHCGVSGGSSYWLYYQPPTNGTITLDTINSTYDTVIEAYTFNGALNSYSNLISIQCDNDSVGSNGAARVQFAVVKTRQYVIAVEGVAGAKGTAWLNYSLKTNQQPKAPTLLSAPTLTVVKPGTPVTLAPSLSGSPPLFFSWKKNQTPLNGVTAPGIFLPRPTTADSADYIVTVTNDLGSLTITLPLHVVTPPGCNLAADQGGLHLTVPTLANQLYTIEESTNVAGPWSPWPTNYPGDGTTLRFDFAGEDKRFFRVRVE